MSSPIASLFSSNYFVVNKIIFSKLDNQDLRSLCLVNKDFNRCSNREKVRRLNSGSATLTNLGYFNFKDSFRFLRNNISQIERLKLYYNFDVGLLKKFMHFMEKGRSRSNLSKVKRIFAKLFMRKSVRANTFTFSNLKYLWLTDGNISNKGLMTLSPIASNLLYLKLDHSDNISDLGLSSFLEKCPNLRSLSIQGCHHIGDYTLSVLAENCRNIRRLNLAGCFNVTDRSLVALSNSPIKRLNLRGCVKITNIGLLQFSKYKKLQYLTLNECYNLTDAGMAYLNDFPLQVLNLYGCFITEEAIQSLENRFPSAVIFP